MTVTVDVPDFMPQSQQFLNLYLGVTTQIAALIATGNPQGNPGGVPLLALNNLLDRQVNAAIAHGAQYQSPPLQVNQPSYDFALSLTFPAGTTAPWLMVVLEWTDSAMNIGFLTKETWFLPGGNSGICEYAGRGITKGDSLTVTVANLDTAQAATFTYAITQHSRIVPRDDIRSTVFNSPNGFTAVSSDLTANILLMDNENIPNGTNITRIMPLYAGRARITNDMIPQASRIIVGGAAASVDPNTVITSGILWDSGAIAANGSVNEVITLPRMPCTARIFNNGTAAASFQTTVIAEEY
jgi:hypothetical protein